MIEMVLCVCLSSEMCWIQESLIKNSASRVSWILSIREVAGCRTFTFNLTGNAGFHFGCLWPYLLENKKIILYIWWMNDNFTITLRFLRRPLLERSAVFYHTPVKLPSVYRFCSDKVWDLVMVLSYYLRQVMISLKLHAQFIFFCDFKFSVVIDVLPSVPLFTLTSIFSFIHQLLQH